MIRAGGRPPRRATAAYRRSAPHSPTGGVPMRWWGLLGVLALAAPAAAADDPELAAPVLVQAGGQPINVDIGHAAPFYGDLDNNGKLHLLVGQFGDGKLRIYRNAGTNDKPRFNEFTWFDGKVPSG